MNIQELNNGIQQLSEKPSKDTAIEFSKSLMQFFGVEAEPKEKVIGSGTQTLQKLLAENPRVKNQPLLYHLSSSNQNISCRFAVVKKINKPTLLRLCYQENFSQSWQANIGNAGTDNLPYTVDFITNEKFSAVTVVITQGEQIRTVTFRERLTNLQRNKMLVAWQNIAAKPKEIINADVWSSLDIKEVNKQFYISIKQKFDALIAEISEQYPDADANEIKMFAIRLIGRYIFCWFLKEKEIIHPDVLSSASLEKYSNRYNKILKRLFFDTLNTFPFPERNYPKDVPQELLKYLGEIPYLNGGLFEPSAEDENFPSISIDGWLLGFIRLLEEYNFTVDESSTNYEQVAIDPEMLGKILENLLASLNPLTEKIANERNAIGAFYTPRPVVDYMVTESLKVFFESQLSDSKEEPVDDNFFTTDKSKTDLFSDSRSKQMAIDINNLKDKSESKEKIRTKIDKLFDASVEKNPFTEAESRQLKQALNDVRIIDPACGSGAFPMGVLHKLEMLHEKFGTDKSPYDLRRMILSQNIYGVDILPMAVEISRLRAWLALILASEHKKTDKKHNYGIEALPNLDFKFVCANTLAEVPHDIATQHQTENLISELEPIIASYFSPDRLDKAAIKKQIEYLIARIVSIKQKRIDDSSKEIERLQNLPENKTKFIDIDGNEVEIKNANASKEKLLKQKTELKEKYEKLKQQWHSYNNIFNHGSVEFFDIKFFFPSVKNDFDIVIGNPPYGIDFADDVKEYLKTRYEYLVQRIRNSFLYFIGIANDLLKKGGVFSYIVPNEFLFQIYMEKARTYFLSNMEFAVAINAGEEVFEAIVPSCIVVIKKRRTKNYSIALKDLRGKELHVLSKELKTESFDLTPASQILESPNATFSFNKSNSTLLNAIMKKAKPFDEYCEDVSNGISTSCDEVYLVDDSFAKSNKLEKKYLKPSLRGSHFNKYYCPDTTNEFVLYITPDYEKDEAPNIYEYLKENKKLLIKKCVEKNSGTRKWHLLFRHRDENLFPSPKIIIRQTGDSVIAAIDADKNYYCINSVHIAKVKVEYIDKMPFLIGVLNSKLSKFIYQEISQESGRVMAEVKPQRVKQMPIPIAAKAHERKIENIVEKIIGKKVENQEADTSKEERQIDVMVYHLFNLSYDEVKIIETELSEEEFEKYKL